ncbi:uncharacterized protein LOC142542469 [Primulina tabacum]|uniref:uncharacterized protein LOC142542469 n=1 Tax=Primulina tabacum TaxID=48773 RepID=UPI003F5A7B25
MQDPSLYSQIRSQVQPQPQFPDQEHLKCPRCDSANTKFCYYNNYNLSQPRHFCKSCKRYWTKGGALRNIPVGGGSRKNTKRSSSSAALHNHQSKRPAASASNNSKTDGASEIKELLPLEGDNYVGQFANSVEVSGGFSSLLGGQFGNFFDGTNGSSLQLKDHFGDPGPGHNMDHQVGLESRVGSKNGNGFLVNGGSGLWLG